MEWYLYFAFLSLEISAVIHSVNAATFLPDRYSVTAPNVCRNFGETYGRILGDKVLLFTNLGSVLTTNTMVIGELDLSTSFSIDDYSSKWWSVNNMTFGSVITGTSSKVSVFSARPPQSNPGPNLFTATDIGLRLFDARNRNSNITTYNETLNTFDPSTGTLTTDIPWPPEIPLQKFPFSGSHILIPEQNVSYWQGAFFVSNAAQLAKYDITNDKWDIQTSPTKDWGNGAFIPMGKQGVLVMIGGSDSVTEEASPLSEVYIYDIASQKWMRQTTDGRIPSPRTRFCTTVASAQDGSSHQIHVYGGYRPQLVYEIEDVRADNHWILSLPSFTWVKAPSTEGREYHHCEKVGRRKMLVIGGLMKRENPSCNRLLEVVDMTTLKTVKEFANEEYEVPSIVTEVIGGNGRGGATLKKPKGGFSSGVEAILSERYIHANFTPAADQGSSTTGNGSTPKAQGPPIGAIVGGAIGGAVALCVIATVIWFLRRRRNRMQAAAGGANASPTKAELEGASESIPKATARTQDSKAELEGASGSNPTTVIRDSVVKEPEQRAELRGSCPPYYELDAPVSPISPGPGVERHYIP
ncbi:hypothetical protein K440DRAFT_638868 [Wilcoxina mikolae CBS 423.85]|nr:hypothetical protein K440DRAFT_638868 [Wilcoxina mikolae CBS 423.85]